MEYLSNSFVGDVIVNDFRHSDAEDVPDCSVPKDIEFVNMALSEGPGFASPQ